MSEDPIHKKLTEEGICKDLEEKAMLHNKIYDKNHIMLQWHEATKGLKK